MCVRHPIVSLLKFTRTTNEAITLLCRCNSNGNWQMPTNARRMCWLNATGKSPTKNATEFMVNSDWACVCISRYENENQRIFHIQRPLENSIELQCGLCACPPPSISRLTFVSNNNSMFNVHRLISCYFWAFTIASSATGWSASHTYHIRSSSIHTYAVYGFHTQQSIADRRFSATRFVWIGFFGQTKANTNSNTTTKIIIINNNQRIQRWCSSRLEIASSFLVLFFLRFFSLFSSSFWIIKDMLSGRFEESVSLHYPPLSLSLFRNEL